MTDDLVILGCGNRLLGDDGFGSLFIDYLTKKYKKYPKLQKKGVIALDVGTGLNKFLFDLLFSPIKPKKIILIDTVCFHDKDPGEVFEVSLEEFTSKSEHFFSLHQVPSTDLLLELRDTYNVKLVIILVQAKEIPEKVNPGLSFEIKKAFPTVLKRVIEECI